jgi:Domain of Unknown Function (DUF349)
MSLFSKLFHKRAPAAVVEPARVPQPRIDAPRPDAAALAREEEAAVAQAVAAGDREALGRWVLEGSSTKVRQAAAQAIVDPEQIGRLVRASRGKDKNVYRILTGKRDALLAAERATQQRKTEVAAAAAAVARRAERPWDATYAGTLDRLEARWYAVATDATPELRSEVAERLARARAALESRRREVEAEAARRHAAIEATEDARRQHEHDAQVTAEAAQEQARVLEAERQAEQARREADDAQVRALLGLLRQAQAALDSGGTARAARLRDAIREKLPQAPALPAWFERKLQDVDARLGELQDWRTFTVVPKRAELVQRMESLVGAEMSPEELARQVRRLRDEWRTVHRGATDESTPEATQFEQAAERAYEPCRDHFARQAERRRENQARREALLERLAAFAAEQAVEQPDWRAIRQVLVEARREWQQYAPVDQHVVKPLQARFHALLDELQGRLDAEYARNVQVKRGLIARAAELVAMEDTRAAIDGARDLQRAWKTVGPVAKHQDDALWAEFRNHCDAVFQRSSQERAAYDAELDANQARAATLCEEVERLAGLTGEPLLSGVKRLGESRAEFDSLELPRASARELRQRFGRASERCDEAIRRERVVAVRRRWAEVFAAAAQVRAYALAVATGLPTADCDALRASVDAAIAGLDDAPKGARNLLEQQVADVAAGAVGVDRVANEAALRLLCVRAELIAGIETPPEDLELRREYQMRRLVEAMGRGERLASGELDDLAFEWLGVGPVEGAVYDALLARFERCRDAYAR